MSLRGNPARKNGRESGSTENSKFTVIILSKQNNSENPTEMIESHKMLNYANKLECAEKSALHINLVGYL